jgi:alpha-L-fucosidase 2
MLLQSHLGEIELLPVLPQAWPEGMITGILAEGGFEVDIKWENGLLEKACIRSRAGNTVRVKYSYPLRIMVDGKEQEFSTGKHREMIFELEKGKTCEVIPAARKIIS